MDSQNQSQFRDPEISGTDLKYVPFPIQELPYSVQQYCKKCADSQSVHPDFYAPAVLAVMGGIIGNVFEVEAQDGGFYQPPALWLFIVADSGSGKSPALKNLTSYLQRQQSKWIKEHSKRRQEWEQQQMELPKKERTKDCPVPPVRQLIISNTTQEAFMKVLSENSRGLFLLKDELSSWVKDFNRYSKNGGDEQNWLECYDAGHVTINRKQSFPPLMRIDRATVSICGGVQPGILARVFGEEQMESGLVSRFVYVMPPHHPRELKRWAVSEDIAVRFNEMIQKMLDLEQKYDMDGIPDPHKIKLDYDAFLMLKEYVDEGSRKAISLNPHLKAAWSKFVGRTARISGILHVAEWAADPTRSGIPTGNITTETMRKAIVISEWFWNECQRVYQIFGIGLADNQLEKSLQKRVELYNWIKSKGSEISESDVVEAKKAVNVEKAGLMLQDLVNNQLADWKDIPTTSRGGRPSRTCKLKPKPDTFSETSQNKLENDSFAESEPNKWAENESGKQTDTSHSGNERKSADSEVDDVPF